MNKSKLKDEYTITKLMALTEGDYGCTIDTNCYCTFDTGGCCTFPTGDGFTFDTESKGLNNFLKDNKN